MFRDVPACSGMFHVPAFIGARIVSKIPLKVIWIGNNHRVYDLYEEVLGELKQLGQMGSVGEESDSNVSSATISQNCWDILLSSYSPNVGEQDVVS